MTPPYADLSFSQLIALARGVTSPDAMARAMLPPLPRMPADLLRECENAARVATTHNPETETK